MLRVEAHKHEQHAPDPVGQRCNTAAMTGERKPKDRIDASRIGLEPDLV
jgi:hypothetical protein